MRFLLISIVILLLSGCLSEPDCVATTNNLVQFRFRDAATNKLIKKHILSIRVSSNGTVLRKDGTVTNNVIDSLATVSLPVNSFVKETTYTFTYKSNATTPVKTDSIKVTYDVQNIIVSVDCGPYIYVSNLFVSASSFVNEPKLLNKQLSTVETVNIELKL